MIVPQHDSTFDPTGRSNTAVGRWQSDEPQQNAIHLATALQSQHETDGTPGRQLVTGRRREREKERPKPVIMVAKL